MTTYEYLEITMGFSNRLRETQQFWVSITFGVLTAGYLVGAQLSDIMVGFVLIVYTLNTFTNSTVSIGVAASLRALRQRRESDRGNDAADPTDTALFSDRLRELSVRGQLIQRAFMYTGTMIYWMLQAGWLG